MGGKEESIIRAAWPSYKEEALKKSVVHLVVQINGKVRGHFDVPVDSSEEELKAVALADEKIKSYIGGKSIRKFIVVPNKLVNIVV
jgi:leucyl-tRNA synthetase